MEDYGSVTPDPKKKISPILKLYLNNVNKVSCLNSPFTL